MVSELHVGCRVQRMHLVVPHARDDHTKCACVYGTAVQPKSSHCENAVHAWPDYMMSLLSRMNSFRLHRCVSELQVRGW